MNEKEILALGIGLSVISAVISYAVSFFVPMDNVRIFGSTLFLGLLLLLVVGTWIEMTAKGGGESE